MVLQVETQVRAAEAAAPSWEMPHGHQYKNTTNSASFIWKNT
jgi:hypothetical protein